MTATRKVAVIGSGISGLSVAHSLIGHADVTLFEAGDYFGGHAHTVDITLPTHKGPVTHGIDTGFLVYNERTYPNLIALFAQLDVTTALSDMSFSVQVPKAMGERTLEWSGSSLATVFSQRSNLWNPRFYKMLWDLLRFNRLCTQLAEHGREARLKQPLGEFLAEHLFSQEFKEWYFLPMLGCIWSCPVNQMLEFPVATMVRFCHNHGLLQVRNRPQWYTVAGGARQYVDKITAAIADKRLNCPVQLVERDGQGVRVMTQGKAERFDKVVMATHAPQALALLRDPSEQERALLGRMRTQDNRAVLHTDDSVLPHNKSAWAAWNYVSSPPAAAVDAVADTRVCLHYLINKLQPIPFTQPVVVSLNPIRDIARKHTMGEFTYAHPVFDAEAIAAQALLPGLQGNRHTYFCGAWTGYGFHEDGLKSGLAVARQMLHEWHDVDSMAPMQKAA